MKDDVWLKRLALLTAPIVIPFRVLNWLFNRAAPKVSAIARTFFPFKGNWSIILMAVGAALAIGVGFAIRSSGYKAGQASISKKLIECEASVIKANSEKAMLEAALAAQNQNLDALRKEAEAARKKVDEALRRASEQQKPYQPVLRRLREEGKQQPSAAPVRLSKAQLDAWELLK